MKFGQFNIDGSHGLMLAHTQRVDKGVIKKGTVLGDADINKLRASNVELVTGVFIDEDDVDEAEVSEKIAQGLCGDGLEVGKPFSGRCNLHAVHGGLLEINAEPIDEINRMGDGVLIATLKKYEVVEAGRTVATIKVAPFALSRDKLATMLDYTKQGAAIVVHPFVPHKIGLILSTVDGQKKSLLHKAREVIVARIESYGSSGQVVTFCNHDKFAVSKAINEIVDDVDIILVLGAVSPSDIKDVVPGAIVESGGCVDVFGIPVDPGNLLISGRIEDKVVIGLPGCARSPALNGIDLVLARLMAKQDISKDILSSFGVGGLLADVSERVQGRQNPVHDKGRLSRKVSAIVLAGGSSRRMGEENKLLAHWQGRPLIRHVVDTALSCQASDVIVVTGHDAGCVRDALAGLNVRYVHNAHFEEGLSTSLRTGVGALASNCGGALILLGDMPRLRRGTVDELIACFDEQEGEKICIPLCEGRQGNPVVWPRKYFKDILDISGDRGAKKLLKTYGEHVIEHVTQDSGVLIDVDTPQALEALISGT